MNTRTGYLFGAVLLAFCALAYEFALAKLVAELTGNATIWESLAFGAFLAGMGARAAWSRPPGTDRERLTLLWRTELILVIVAAAAIPFMYGAEALYRIHLYDAGALRDSFWPFPPVTILGVVLQLAPAAVGWLSGYELTFLLSYDGAPPLRRRAATVLAAYHFGALLGLASFLVSLRFGLAPYEVIAGAAVLNALFIVAYGRKWIGAILAIGLLAMPWAGRSLEQLHLKNRHYNTFTWRSDVRGLHDVTHPGGLLALIGRSHEAPEITRIRTPFQVIDIVQQDGVAAMHINGRFQVDPETSARYHDAMIDAALALAGRPARKALILGGGDGGLLRSVLRAPEVQATVVDVDKGVVDATRRYLPGVHGGALDDQRAKVLIDDAVGYLKLDTDRYDLVLLDVTYPFDFDSARFLSVEVLRLVARRLAPGGIFALGAPTDLVAAPTSEVTTNLHASLRAAGFADVVAFNGTRDHYLAAAREPMPGLLPLPRQKWLRLPDLPTNAAAWSVMTPRSFGVSDPFY